MSGEDSSLTTEGSTVSASSLSSGRVYVGNLSFGTGWQNVKDFFRDAVGSVGRVEVLTYPNGRSKGCAIVEFEDNECAARAINELNGTQLQGRKIFIREDRESKGFGSEQRPHAYNNKITRGPSDNNNNNGEDEESAGGGGGEGSSSSSRGGRGGSRGGGRGGYYRGRGGSGRGGRGRGGFYQSRGGASSTSQSSSSSSGEKPEDSADASSASADSSSSSSSSSSSRPKPEPGTQIYVGNLPWRASWQDIKDLFSQYGEVARADVMTERGTGRSKGFGIVRFVSATDAAAAVENQNDKEFNGRKLIVRLDEYA